MKLRIFIEKLRKDQKLVDYRVNKERVKCLKRNYTCNQYKLSKEFIEFLDKVKEFTKKTFEYITYTPEDVIQYVSSFAKKKYGQWKFYINGIKYVVNERGKWRGKILDTQNQKIISLITIQNLYS